MSHVRRLTRFSFLGLLAFCMTCANDDKPPAASLEPFATFRAGDASWSYGARANQMVDFEAPCVYVSARTNVGIESVSSCPMKREEQHEYGAAVEVHERAFVVGYGLEEGEQLVLPEAQHVHLTEPIDGRRYFFAEIPGIPPTPTFDLEITDASGGKRVIPVHGPSQ